MNEKQRDATHEFADKAVKTICKGPDVVRACVIILQNQGLERAVSTICMEFPVDFRARLPEMFRDLAFSVEQENLMSGVKTEPLGKVSTEVLKSETRHI